MLDEKIARLKAVPMLASFDDIALHHLAFNSQTQSATDGTNLFVEGDSAPGALFIEKGTVGLYLRQNDKNVETSRVFAGAILDPSALVVQSKRPLTAKAIGHVTYQLLERAIFKRILENYPGHAERLEEHMKSQLTQTIHALSGAASRLG